ncbi:precorrin-6y C5,15-methyltransferase (decarboxylating) subunit CbiE [Actinophytocola sp.]|uniref:precorrin-6y C5,15-methyltransferase (decarboxylating) subunit CbiE n=1 Tax=Actinophytocola sp. TaxID=1872138 RepID=UPI002D7F8C0D|nr:precorrin-6y C5,15-methyltransferase (decarboxylating) subunit CbiE [Actinophytocola sp.]HET9137945.1 precorrin-6y C5,15-methyltransferase (decarboxylating) subunit CbiE [Actinophytocola sp.]HEU5109301.1 precorrin-6y C5,15-methyltransferase (decarboxylating) subunit CbiE [Micromonosporaceae bacterium]
MVTVVGIGADGWAGLSAEARAAVDAAEVLIGSARQLALLEHPATRVTWPSPMLPAIPGLLAEHAGRRICVLASGDPMLFGVGSVLARLLGAAALQVIPHVSSVSLACARLGWPVEEVEVVSLVGRPLDTLRLVVRPDRRLLVLSATGSTPAEVANLLRDQGFGPSPMTVFEDLGAPHERRRSGTATSWRPQPAAALNLVAVHCRPAPDAVVFGHAPGLPDHAFDNDGQLTKREVRAVTLAVLAPMPRELLWDVGAGSGSIGIEWMRTDRTCRAIAIEPVPERAARITRNAAALGVPDLRVVTGAAPAALADLPTPHAIFIGGGLTNDGMLEACWSALPPGGRLVANAVTLDSEAVLADWHRNLGGTLTRIEISRASPLGSFTSWRPQLPITQWTITHP